MKRSIPCLTAVLTLLAAPACEDALSETTGQPYFRNGVNSITVLVYDAMNGAGIVDADVTVQVGHYVLPAHEYGHVYTVSGIPPGTFPIYIEADGYLTFIGNFTFTGSGDLTNPNQNRTYITRSAIMFPMETVETDIRIRAYDGETGEPVHGGRVVATIDPAVTPQGVITVTDEVLQGTLGLRPMTQTVDLSDGRAVFSREDLVYGATYNMDVIGARNADDAWLQPTSLAGFRAGRDHPELVVFMGPPAVTPVALSANNEQDGTHTELVIRFPYPMEVCSDARNHTWVNESGDTNANGVAAEPDPNDPLTLTLSNGDEVLTLAPNIASGTRDDGDRLRARIEGVGVRVTGTRGTNLQTCVPIEQIQLRNTGTNVSNRILMQAGP